MARVASERLEPALRGFQRKYLRGLAHHLRPFVRVGAAGITDPLLAALDRALRDHELVKVRLVAPDGKQGLARTLAAASSAELCGLVGHTVILYRAHPDAPRIELPQPAATAPPG